MFTRHRTIRSRSQQPREADAHGEEVFPRAVAGEDYDRYARAMARSADQWLVAHLARLHGTDLDAQELRDRLRVAAMTELRRELYPQEERLLSDVFQRRPEASNSAERVEPEIPSFLIDRLAS